MIVPVLLLCLGTVLTVEDKPKAKDPKTIDAELAALAKDLDAAEKDQIAEKVRAFAREHAPAKGKAAVLLSKDKKVHVVIGAPATEKDPSSADVEFKPEGTQYSIAVGGKGFDAKSGQGGTGGTVTLEAKSKSKCILIGGEGGHGADVKEPERGGKGGRGGNVWYGDYLKEGDLAVGGSGGQAGSPGGAGGDGGDCGPKPGK